MNFKMRPEVSLGIRTMVARLARRRVKYALGSFPLSFPEVAKAAMTPEQHELSQKLASTGFDQFKMHRTVAIYIDSREYNVRRSVMAHLALPEYAMLPKQAFMSFRNTKRIDEDEGDMALERAHQLNLDDDQKDALAVWATRVVRETRLETMINWVTWQCLANCGTTGHVLAVWPYLGTMTQNHMWRARFRDAPRKIKNYAPSYETIKLVSQEIKIAEALLHGAEMLEPWSQPNDPNFVKASLVGWQWLQGDRDYAMPDGVQSVDADE